VHSISYVQQVENHTAEPLEPDPNPFEVVIATAELKNYKLPTNDQIQKTDSGRR
jgi:hypothetical protein